MQAGGGASNQQSQPRHRRAVTPGGGAIKGTGRVVSGLLLALLVALGAWIINRLMGLPAPASHMHDQSVPASWPVFSLAQMTAYAGSALSRRVVPPGQTVAEDAFAFARSMMLYSACRLDVATRIGNEGRALPDLAADMRADSGNLFRLLRALEQWGYFQRDAAGAWWNTALSSLLRRDHPNCMCPISRHLIEDSWSAWEKLPRALTDDTFRPFDATVGAGKDFWGYLRENATQRAQFEAAMAATDALGLNSVLADYPWDKHHHSRVIDVGGSLGSLLHGILAANTRMTGVLFDLPDVTESARGAWAARSTAGAVERAIADRVTFHGGSFLSADELPRGKDGDIYAARTVLHDWSDEDSVRILRNIRAAMGGSKATLALVEQVVAEPADPVGMRGLIDMHMRVITGTGRERTELQWAELLRNGGFRLERVVPTRSLYSVIEAVPH